MKSGSAMLHPIKAYDDDLSFLYDRLAQMGGEAERLVEQSVRALLTADTELAREVVASDRRLDLAQREIDDRAVLTIARRQPLAHDLRSIIGVIRIAGDLERVGDLGKNIGRRVVSIEGSGEPLRLFRGIEALAEMAVFQIGSALDAFVSGHVEGLERMRERDEEIDAKYTSLFRETLTYMMEDTRNISPCTHLLFCAKNIERMGDHATNIAETVYFIATGYQMSIERAKHDASHQVRVGVGKS